MLDYGRNNEHKGIHKIIRWFKEKYNLTKLKRKETNVSVNLWENFTERTSTKRDRPISNASTVTYSNINYARAFKNGTFKFHRLIPLKTNS